MTGTSIYNLVNASKGSQDLQLLMPVQREISAACGFIGNIDLKRVKI